METKQACPVCGRMLNAGGNRIPRHSYIGGLGSGGGGCVARSFLWSEPEKARAYAASFVLKAAAEEEAQGRFVQGRRLRERAASLLK